MFLRVTSLFVLVAGISLGILATTTSAEEKKDDKVVKMNPPKGSKVIYAFPVGGDTIVFFPLGMKHDLTKSDVWKVLPETVDRPDGGVTVKKRKVFVFEEQGGNNPTLKLVGTTTWKVEIGLVTGMKGKAVKSYDAYKELFESGFKE